MSQLIFCLEILGSHLYRVKKGATTHPTFILCCTDFLEILWCWNSFFSQLFALSRHLQSYVLGSHLLLFFSNHSELTPLLDHDILLRVTLPLHMRFPLLRICFSTDSLCNILLLHELSQESFLKVSCVASDFFPVGFHYRLTTEHSPAFWCPCHSYPFTRSASPSGWILRFSHCFNSDQTQPALYSKFLANMCFQKRGRSAWIWKKNKNQIKEKEKMKEEERSKCSQENPLCCCHYMNEYRWTIAHMLRITSLEMFDLLLKLRW